MTAWGKNPYLILDLNFTFKLHNQSIDDFLYVSWTIKSSSWAIMLLKIKLSDTKTIFFQATFFSWGKSPIFLRTKQAFFVFACKIANIRILIFQTLSEGIKLTEFQ